MARKNNVNPDHYKEEGRERPGQDINQEINKQKLTQARNEQRIRNMEESSKFIPGGASPIVNEKPIRDVGTGQPTESANSSSNT